MKLLAAGSVTALLMACGSSSPVSTSSTAPPRGTIVFVREHGDEESLFTIRADGVGERQLLTTPAGPALWSHRGDRLLVSAFGSIQKNLITTATVKADGGDYTVFPLASPGLNLGPGAWSPDDSHIALEGWDDVNPSRNGIYVADAVDGGNLRRLTKNAALTHDIPISYSPDGTKILFWRGPADEEPGELFLVGADGGDPTRLNPPGMTVRTNSGDPGGWSPDGTRISFAAFSATPYPGRSAVFVAAGDGTNPQQISDWGTGTTNARWSPRGDWIVFDKVNASGGRHGFFLIHPDGSGTRAVSSIAGVCCAVWSPDGDRLLFTRGPNDNASDLWTMELDGSHLVQLTHSPAAVNDIGWTRMAA